MPVGVYSEIGAARYGTQIWLTADGLEVEIVTTGLAMWPDAVAVGEVVKPLRKGRAPQRD